jgi:hypothetical protein
VAGFVYYRDLFAHKLGVSRSEDYYLAIADGYLWAVCAFHTANASRRGHTKDGGLFVYETFGFNVPSHYNRLNKLFMMCLTCRDFRDTLIRENPSMAYVGDFDFQTTCLSDVPELKANRGVLKLVERSTMPNGKYKLNYRAKFADCSFSDQLAKWLKKDAHVFNKR